MERVKMTKTKEHTALDIVKRAYEGWDNKNTAILEEVLHKDYKATMPGGMDIVGIEGAKKCLEGCPFECHSENEVYIADADGLRVMRIWDFVVTAPQQFRTRMAELSVVKDGKVIANEAFFDPTSFPREVQEMTMTACQDLKK